MKPNLCAPVAWFATVSLLLFGAAGAAAQSVAALSLQEVLAAALQRAANQQQAADAVPYQASSWLAGVPSVGLTYLESDQRNGTDETELNLNLPLKSGHRRKADEALQGLAVDLDGLGLHLRELYYSGLLREILWAYRLADTRRRFAAEKRLLLLELEQRQQDLLAASATSEYALLLLQMELVEVEVAQQEYLQEARHWLQRYRQLTGLDDMPSELGEDAPHGSLCTRAASPVACTGAFLQSRASVVAGQQRTGRRLEPVTHGQELRDLGV